MSETNRTEGFQKNKKNAPFSDAEFSTQEIADLIGISRASIYEAEKNGVIFGREIPSGSTTKKIYSWNDLLILSNKYKVRRKVPKENKIKVFANLKGGVGKSSLSSQFAMRASSCGLKTLLIDLDPQGHATIAVGLRPCDDMPTISEVLIHKKPISSVIREITPLLYLVPANLGLSTLEIELFQQSKREQRLSECLEQIRNDWDLIVIDTNPSASIVNINAILAADELCIVTATDFLSVTGLKMLFTILKELEEDFDTSPSVRIIPNLFDVRDGIAQESLGLLRQSYRNFLTNTVVRKNTDLKEAQKRAQSIMQYNRKSLGAEDISSMTDELLTESNC